MTTEVFDECKIELERKVSKTDDGTMVVWYLNTNPENEYYMTEEDLDKIVSVLSEMKKIIHRKNDPNDPHFNGRGPMNFRSLFITDR